MQSELGLGELCWVWRRTDGFVDNEDIDSVLTSLNFVLGRILKLDW